MLKIEEVRKGYDKREVLHGINMHVKKGSIHGLIGENGSGKTTLLKCVTGIYKPESGQITLEGAPVFENPVAKERMGYVADNNIYFPRYRLGKMVDFFKHTYPKFDVQKCIDLNKVFQLNMNKRVNELSKGQKMRFAFMLNLAANTDILVMDEPTSGVDAVAKRQIFDILINEVDYRDLTVLITSHNLLELEKLCDDLTIIKDGRVTEQNQVDVVKQMVRKLNFVFDKGVPQGFLQHEKIMTYSNIGNIYTVVFDKVTSSDLDEIQNLYQPIYSEELPVNLEEVFVYTHGGGQSEE